MYPQSPQIDPYDPKTLDALGEAFDATWVVLQAAIPFVISNAIQNLRLPSVRSS